MARHSSCEPGSESTGRRSSATRSKSDARAELAPETLIPQASDVAADRVAGDTPMITNDDRLSLIAIRAYQLAEQRGFQPGAELDDWLCAEREVDSRGIQPSPEDQFTG